MKRIIRNIAMALAVMSAATGCYDDYLKDYDKTACYFASQKPLRTVIADRDMTIQIGVAIGGKRKADMADWAKFIIDETLLDGTGLTLLPENYYKLSDDEKMTLYKEGTPIAVVTISFTDDFYNDPKSASGKYALPFRIVDSSLNTILEGKDYSIVAIKYISSFHGAYYAKGVMTATDGGGKVVETDTYIKSDISSNMVRKLSTVSRSEVCRQGVGSMPLDIASEKVLITLKKDGTLTTGTAEGGVAITEGNGTWEVSQDGTMTMKLNYSFAKSGYTYNVTETLVRRQDPYKDLVYEEW